MLMAYLCIDSPRIDANEEPCCESVNFQCTEGKVPAAKLDCRGMQIRSGNPEISPGGVQNEKIENSQTLPGHRSR